MISKQPRFLFLRGGAIGDFILTLPALSALRDRWPDAHIEVVGYPHIARLAQAGGLADAVRSLDEAGMARFFSHRPAFPQEQIQYIRSFDIVFSYLHDRDGIVQNNLKLAGAKLVIYGSPLVESGHAVDHLLRPLESLAIFEADVIPRLVLGDDHRKGGREILRAMGITGPVAALHSGSGSRRKNWPADRFVALAERIKCEGRYQPLFIVGEADQPPAGEMPVLSGCELSEVAGVLSECAVYVGNDSGITHLAAALGLPVVALYGPSDADRWGARGERVTHLRSPDGDLNNLETAQVFEAVGDIR